MSFARLLAVLLIALVATPSLSARQHPVSDPPQAGAPALDEIHVDQFCRVLTPGRPTAANPNPIARYRHNSIICHHESILASSHWEQIIQNGVPKNIHVTVREREFLLQNVTGEPVTFVVEQSLPKGWRIDSDPQPDAVLGSTAIFRIIAQPNQIVRLHVGERS